MIKIPREQTEFVTGEGILGFPALFPGQAVDSQTPGSKSYKLEWAGDIQPDEPIVKAVSIVAQAHDPANWQHYVFGPVGRLRKLEEMASPIPGKGRDASKYPYAAGKYLVGFSKTISLKFLKMEGADLSDPSKRALYNAAIDSNAPPVRKYCNVANPTDVAQIEAMNLSLRTSGRPPIPESDYYKTLIPVRPDEIWAGCIVRVLGRAFWSATARGREVLLGLESVLLVRQGERIVGEVSPERHFGAFAPPAELAPPPPVAGFNLGNLF
jgi:hypothetical protein